MPLSARATPGTAGADPLTVLGFGGRESSISGRILLHVSFKLDPSYMCPECGAIARELRASWKTDVRELRGRLQSVASSSGRDLRTLGIRWVMSVSEMPDDEMAVLLRSHYPRVTEAQRKKEEHETATGHSVSLNGWWMFYAYRFGGEE